MTEKTDYSTWSQESLIERVAQLEKELKEKNRRFIMFPRRCLRESCTDNSAAHLHNLL
jgi:hypothetical protein